MRGLRGEARPVNLSRRRRIASDPDRLVRLFSNRRPVSLVTGVHTSAKYAGVYLLHNFVVVRPRFYPIDGAFGSLYFPINRNLHSGDQLPHSNLQVIRTAWACAICLIAMAI